jgi:hypothetical protein
VLQWIRSYIQISCGEGEERGYFKHMTFAKLRRGVYSKHFEVGSRSCEMSLSLVMSPHPSVRPNGTHSAPSDEIFMKFDTTVFLENVSRKFKFI